MRELTEGIQSLMDIETAHPGLLSRPLLAYLKEWLVLDDCAKATAIPVLYAKLVDGQDCDFTGTKWEAEWLASRKICQCKACIAARKCIANINCIISTT